MQLTIYSTKYPCFTIDIDILDELLTVEHIKNMIANIKKIPIERQVLLCEAEPMDNETRISNYNLSTEPYILLIVLYRKHNCCTIL